jgi:hypothetical protein
MNDEIAVVRNDRPIEGDSSDAAPIPEGTPLAKRRAVRLPVIGDVDVECEHAFRSNIAAIVDLRHERVLYLSEPCCCVLSTFPKARSPLADQRRRHAAHHSRHVRLHDRHRQETRAAEPLAARRKLVLAKEDVLTVSRALELALFYDAQLEVSQI